MKEGGLILIVSGGTGGHVFPAVALNTELRGRGWETSIITDARGRKFTKVEDGTQIYQLTSARPGRTIFSGLRRSLFMGFSFIKAIILIKKLNPTLVIGFGGSTTIPSIFAATLLGHPTIIHEQNSILGQANKLLAKYVDLIAVAYPNVLGVQPRHQSKIVMTGNPVRAEIRAVTHKKETNSKQILVLGGSQGAKIFGQVIPKAIKLLPKDISNKMVIFQQCRDEDIENVKAEYAKTDVISNLSTFFSNIPELMATSCLIISRAGASTIAELNVIGRPAILVPYPSAMDDHQTANALNLTRCGAGWMIPQKEFGPIALAERLTACLTSSNILQSASISSAKIGQPNATQKLAETIENLCGSPTRRTL